MVSFGAACTPEVLLERDGGVLIDAGRDDEDAGPADAGVVDVEDAGVDVPVDAGPLCAIEPFEVPFECEGDEDWCDPRDQARAYNDLAAVWSRIEDDAWVIEVRTWGRLPFFEGQRGSADLRVVWNEPGEPSRQLLLPSSVVFDDCEPIDPLYFGTGFDRMTSRRSDSDDFYIFCITENRPSESLSPRGEIVNFGGCLRWMISDDFTTWQVRIPVNSNVNVTVESVFSV